MDIFEIRGIALFIIAFLNLILALLLWTKSKGDKAKLWLGFTALFSGLYAFSCAGTYFFWQINSVSSMYWGRATFTGVLLLPPFNIFTYYFTNNTNNLKLKASLFYTGAILISLLAMTTDFFDAETFLTGYNISATAGPLDFVGRIYIFIGLVSALLNLFKGYLKAEGSKKIQLRYFIIGTTIFAGVGIISTSVIPLFTGTSSFYDIAAYFSFIWVAFTAYAILRHHLFDIRVFAKELLTFGVWIILFIRIVLSNSSKDFLLNIALAILLTILGILFLKSVYKERELDQKLLEEAKKDLDFEKRLKEIYAQIAENKISKIR